MLLVLLALCLLRIGYSQIFPSSVPVPSNAITAVTFSCSATQLVSWRLNGTVLTIDTIPTGVSVKNSGGVPTLNVDKESVLTYNGTSIQCRQAGENFSSVPTAFIIVYGPPSEPVDLSSESVSDGVLVFSWYPPWAPDGVQLSYAVTVTNTNTSVVRNYTTSNTSITLTRSDVGGDGECDQYVWSVTAINPAGISVPANYTTALSFKPGLIFSTSILLASVNTSRASMSSSKLLSTSSMMMDSSTTLSHPFPPENPELQSGAIVGFSVGIVLSFILGMGTTAVLFSVYMCIIKGQGNRHMAAKRSSTNEDPVTAENEAYGLHSIPAAVPPTVSEIGIVNIK